MYSSSSQQIPIRPHILSVQVPSGMNYAGQNESPGVANQGVQNGVSTQAEANVNPSKKLENDMILLGKQIKQHEENIKFLKNHKNSLEDVMTDKQVTLGKYRSSTAPNIKDEDLSHMHSEDATIKSIMKYEKSAAAVFCLLKRQQNQAAHIKDIVGVVATLGKVNDDNLSRLLSEYVGMDNMMTLVCKTYDGVKALVTYENEGGINTNTGLYGLATAIGQTLEGRINVICLESLRSYVGEYLPNDPQRRLDIAKPRLPNGETPPGFIGFAINMIHIDNAHLFYLTHDGNGLRETLFYTLFSRLQVYKTRTEMLQAVPCINDGAISLDGGIIKSTGVYCLGNREEMDVKFPIISGVSYLPEAYFQVEKEMKELKCKRERLMEDIQREEKMLTEVKNNFEVKKQEFIGVMAQSSPYTMQKPFKNVMDPNAEVDNFSEDSDIEDIKAINACFNPIAMLDFLDSLEEDEAEPSPPKVPKRSIPRRFIPRDRRGAGERLWRDYFSDTPKFPEDYFRKRFRMRKSLFIRVCRDISSYSQLPIPPYFSFFHQKRDATGIVGFNVFQKCTSAILQLAYGYSTNVFDEYLQMGQQTQYDCLDNFCKSVFHLYSTEYLRKPTQQDVQRLHSEHLELHGFPGMLGSIDCMYWPWENCPVAWKGQYPRDDQGRPTIMLEAVASYDLWIWHAYFEPAGSKDTNVLNQSDLFNDLLQDRAPTLTYNVNGVQFNQGYYLADRIYPEWATFVKPFKCTDEPKNIKFNKFQESARKDVERAFIVLQGRWGIIKNPSRSYKINKIRRIMYCCVILHNMITEDNRRAMCELEENYLSNPTNHVQRSWSHRVEGQLCVDKELQESRVHHQLRNALIEHIWNLPSNYHIQNYPHLEPSNNSDDPDE